jgi:hypothetical protein
MSQENVELVTSAAEAYNTLVSAHISTSLPQTSRSTLTLRVSPRQSRFAAERSSGASSPTSSRREGGGSTEVEKPSRWATRVREEVTGPGETASVERYEVALLNVEQAG